MVIFTREIVQIRNLECPVVSYWSICLRGSKTLRLNASSTLIGCAVSDSAPGCVDDDVTDASDVTVLFFFLSALLDSAALVTSLRPAACVHHTPTIYYLIVYCISIIIIITETRFSTECRYYTYIGSTRRRSEDFLRGCTFFPQKS